MQIPTINADINAGTAPIQGQVEVHDNLAGLAQGLDTIAQRQNEINRQTRTAQSYLARTNAQTSVEQLSEQAKTDIANGADPEKAMAKYQDSYQKVIDEQGQGLATDQDRALFRAHVERSGVQGQIQLQEAVNQKNRQAAQDGYSNRADLLQDQLAKTAPGDQPAIISQIAQNNAGAVSSGVITHEAAQMHMRNTISNGLALSASMIGNDNPSAGLAYISQHKDSIDGQSFVQLHNKFSNEIATIKTTHDAARLVANFQKDPYNNARPKPDDVNTVYGQMLTTAKQQNLPPAQIETKTVTLAESTGVIPPALRDQSSNYLAMDPATASKDDIATIASTARVVSAIGSQDQKYAEGNKFNSQDVYKANAIVERMNAGMDERTAIAQVATITNNPQNEKQYDTYQNFARSQIAKGSFSAGHSFLGIGQTTDFGSLPPSAQSLAIDTYAQARVSGASETGARKQAAQTVNGNWGKFDGELVQHPPSAFGVSYSDDLWKQATKETYQSAFGVVPPKGTKTLLMGDRQTQIENQQGKPLTFQVWTQAGAGDASMRAPVYDKKGKPLRVSAQPGWKAQPKAAPLQTILPGGEILGGD